MCVNPGLYGGVTSDSLLNYLIKAGGVDPERGSYVDIVVKRGNRVRSNVNLYDFLLNGKLGLSQFADGDTIIVGPRQHTSAFRAMSLTATTLSSAKAAFP
ncbi:polysialic acid transport protein [Escherichia coli]|uniref:Polysialic acid transport protein n=1 Tax=Escherichia coli TaxID=562 RepID=A0A376MJ63_ECOLX|nr:polysialic acid transport protein [Escherichia coli]